MASANESYPCEYCDSEFTSSKSLDNHKRTAKYCLTIQGKNRDKYKCEECNKVFSNNHWLINHYITCIPYQIKLKETEFETAHKKLEQENISLRTEIEKLTSLVKEKDQIIKELAEKAINNAKPSITNNHTTNNNTTINNLQIMSDAHIKEQAKHLTIDHIKKGALGYSEYFLEYPLKERVACTDYSRRKIKYKNENGEIITDPEMTNLAERLFQSIKDRNRELTIQYTKELTDKYGHGKGAAEISYFMDLATKFSEQDLEVFKMFNGDKNEFFHDILRHICSKTLI